MDENYASHYGELQRNHWWFRARHHVLREVIATIRWPQRPKIMEVGCGPGETLYLVYPPDADLTGVEPDAITADVARKRGPVPVIHAGIEMLATLVPDASLDGVAMLDVLEHIQDDHAAVRAVHAKLKPGGVYFLTVPAFMWMWGRQDDVSHHCRRYTKSTILAPLVAAGFEIERITYFSSFLFPMIAGLRVARRLLRLKPSGESDLDDSIGPFNEVLNKIFAAEAWWLRHANFPIGSSILCIARRKS